MTPSTAVEQHYSGEHPQTQLEHLAITMYTHTRSNMHLTASVKTPHDQTCSWLLHTWPYHNTPQPTYVHLNGIPCQTVTYTCWWLHQYQVCWLPNYTIGTTISRADSPLVSRWANSNFLSTKVPEPNVLYTCTHQRIRTGQSKESCKHAYSDHNLIKHNHKNPPTHAVQRWWSQFPYGSVLLPSHPSPSPIAIP